MPKQETAANLPVVRPHNVPRATPVASAAAQATLPAAWLIARLYAVSDKVLRVRLLRRLLQPLGTLGMAAVAAGAFAGFVHRRSSEGVMVLLDDVSHYSSEQILELARFVEQVNPDSLQQAAGLLADHPVGLAALGTSAAMLLLSAVYRSVHPVANARPGRQQGD